MSEIISINPTGLFSFGLHHTIKLKDAGLVHLTGDNKDRITQTANMAGKSSLPNALCHILFGEDPVGASDTEVVNSVWGKGCWGKVTFDNNGLLYRVVLVREWHGQYPDSDDEQLPYDLHRAGHRIEGTDLFFDVFKEGSFTDARGASVRETRAKIIKAFGMSYRQFITTSYLAQQSGSLIVTGKNKERMKIVTELCDMEQWDRGVNHARALLAIEETAAGIVDGKINGLKLSLDRIPQPLSPDALTDLEGKIYIYKMGVDDNASKLTKLGGELTFLNDTLVKTIQQRDKVRNAIQDNLRDAGVLASEIVNIKIKYMELQGRVAFPDDAAKVDAVRQQVAALQADGVSLRARLRNAMGAEGTCEQCGSTVSAAALTTFREKLAAEVQQNEATIQELGKQLAEIQGQLVRRISDKNAELRAQQGDETDAVNIKIATKGDECKELQAVLEKLEHALGTINTKIGNATTNIETIKQEQAQNGLLIQQYTTQLAQNAALADQRAQIQHEIDAEVVNLANHKATIKRLKIVISGMGDKGIKAHKFGAIIATLNELIAEYIDILTDGQVQVWFSPWRERSTAKTADDVVAEIKIYVREGPKEEVELKLYSGAEKQQITLAIIHAFWRLALMQHGGTNLLVLDETMDCMDHSTMGNAIKLINHIKNTHYGSIIMITHSDYIKTQVDFDHTWVATKQQHLSTISEVA